jgi:arylsulfatase A-like enzyme
MSADDLVATLFERLEETGELDNTIAVFMSDNGMLWGEHGFTGKRHPYSDSIKIPLFLRWPGHIDPGAQDERLVANIDIAPTVMDAVGVDAIASDGFSLLGDVRREHLLVEHWGDEQTSIPDWASIRSLSQQYTEYYEPGGAVLFREYYDLESDPYQLRNRAIDRTSPRMDRLHRRLARDRECVDQTCP